MIISQREAAGFTRWQCYTCGRIVLMRPDPYKKIVIFRGDEYTAHVGGSYGVHIDEPAVELSFNAEDEDWLAQTGIRLE
jgi:hypothetical protein